MSGEKQSLFAGVILTLGMVLITVPARAVDEASRLREVLHTQYPEVESWEITTTRSIRAKRLLEPVARTSNDVSISHDGNLFVVQSNGIVNHYIVKANKHVRVAGAFAKKGTALNSLKVSLEVRDVFAFGCDPSDKSAWTEKMRLRKDVHRGEVICSNNLEQVPLVSKYASLLLQCNKGDVIVSVPAEALEEGDLGDAIKVRRHSSRAVTVAKITGSGEANACI